MKSSKNDKVFLWLGYVAIAIIAIAFFVISYCGFYWGDDLSMAYDYGKTPSGSGERVGGISSLVDVFKLTWWWYFHLGGRFFSVAAQYLFCGLLQTKIWFDLVNTLFFVLLMFICGHLVNGKNKGSIRYVLLFALLFWFLCPMPNETLFWVAGATTHLWGNTLVFVFLLLFFHYKDDNGSNALKAVLFFVSFISAAEFIPCASICGAFVVYYILNVKKFKGNSVPLVVGFVMGSVLLLFAPGSIERASMEMNPSIVDRVKDFVSRPLLEVCKYKSLWLFLAVCLWGWKRDKGQTRIWIKNNSFLLLSLGWGVVAFSVVFRPENRALFFPETLSLVLFLKFLSDNFIIFRIKGDGEKMINRLHVVRSAVLTLLFALFMVDTGFAVAETKNQNRNNELQLKEIEESDGMIALDRVIPSHRMACVASFPKWTWEPLADRFGLDSVHVYPFYCQEKLYMGKSLFENVYIDEVNLKDDYDLFGKYVRLIVRIDSGEVVEQNNRVSFKIEYTRPRKWYKSWLDKWRNYQYDRTAVVERNTPDVCFDGYCYYVIWFGRENVDGLKSVKYEIE